MLDDWDRDEEDDDDNEGQEDAAEAEEEEGEEEGEKDKAVDEAATCSGCYHVIIKKSLSCWSCGFMYWGEGACRDCGYALDAAWVKKWSMWCRSYASRGESHMEPDALPEELGEVRRMTGEEVGKLLVEKWADVELPDIWFDS